VPDGIFLLAGMRGCGGGCAERAAWEELRGDFGCGCVLAARRLAARSVGCASVAGRLTVRSGGSERGAFCPAAGQV